MNYNLSSVDSIRNFLIEHKKTLSVAESVTSGHLQAALSQAANASEFFQGGITAYNYGQKCRHLHIEPIHALQNNCVSSEIAEQMATEVNHLFLSDFAIGITGYASCVPEMGIDALFAYAAIASKKEILFSGKLIPEKSSEGMDAQIDYTNQITTIFAKILADQILTL